VQQEEQLYSTVSLLPYLELEELDVSGLQLVGTAAAAAAAAASAAAAATGQKGYMGNCFTANQPSMACSKAVSRQECPTTGSHLGTLTPAAAVM
jgi:hypothetical protein